MIDLKTRIAQSLTIRIAGLSDKEIVAALLLRAKNKNLSISEDIFQYLQKTYSRDLKKLMDILERLNQKSLESKKNITKIMVKSII